MKKGLSVLLTVTLLMTSFLTYVMAETYDEVATEAVSICTSIGMVVGSGGGVTDEYLGTTPKRYQGAVMLLRLKGILSDATGYSFTDNYTDYTDLTWAPAGQNMLGYIYDHEDVGFSGYPDGSFKPYGTMTAKQYYKLVLETLGYEYLTDYSWSGSGTLPDVMAFAQSIGLVWLQGNEEFTMRDLCVATAEALKTDMADGSETLAQKLVDDGMIDASTAESLGLIPQTVVDPDPTASISVVNGYETAVITGETMLTIALSDGTFVDDLGDNNDDTTDLLDGIHGSESTAISWDSLVSLDHSNVTRLSDTQILIDIDNTADYRIGDDEEITITIPRALINEDPDDDLEVTVTIEDCGSGATESPWKLYNAEDFAFVASNVETDFDYKLMDNVDFSGVDFSGIDSFSGVFDGNDKVIYNLDITGTDVYTGMFDSIDGAEIKDLGFMSCAVDSSFGQTAVAVGYALNSTISNVHVQGSNVSSTYWDTAAVVGNLESSTLMSSSAINVVISNTEGYCGGLVGFCASSTIQSSYVSGAAINEDIYNADMGGIAGYADSSIIDDCQFTGDVYGSDNVGGIVGTSSSNTVTGCKAYGEVFGTLEDIGGIVGAAYGGSTITGNYCGLDAIHKTVVDPDDLGVHRIAGDCDTSNNTLSNSASSSTKLYDADLTDYSDNWVSDVAGLDGAVYSIFQQYNPGIITDFEFDIPDFLNP